MVSSTSGLTKMDAKDVCLLALESNGEYGLYSHDLDTGKEQPIRTFSDRLVFVALSANGR